MTSVSAAPTETETGKEKKTEKETETERACASAAVNAGGRPSTAAAAARSRLEKGRNRERQRRPVRGRPTARVGRSSPHRPRARRGFAGRRAAAAAAATTTTATGLNMSAPGAGDGLETTARADGTNRGERGGGRVRVCERKRGVGGTAAAPAGRRLSESLTQRALRI